MDLDDKVKFPDWGNWWKAYQGEVLKPRGKMQVFRINVSNHLGSVANFLPNLQIQTQHLLVNLTNLQVNHGKFLPPAFMEGIMDNVGLAMTVYAQRGTANYENLRKQLPVEYQDSYHRLIQVKVNWNGNL